ncbi:uncharacterized protein LOC107875067 [Capsicum annuum]|uniref:uncharacterized protein LOC107875067 n=1 Tax=Capsicum annuum TaxID=4072 RepID=UPI001FB06A33|nr:uncharacterized protein LOC107875067 [Capsicum annuum]
MWDEVDDPLKSKAQIMDKVSDGIPPDQWISFIEYNFKESTKMTETGQWPRRSQIYIATHKNQDGLYVNETAKEICEKIELALSQSTMMSLKFRQMMPLISQLMQPVDLFRPWMQGDHVIIVILMIVVDFIANCLGYSSMS